MVSILPQLIVNGLIAGSIYALAAAGFSLVYNIMKFQYFSHGAVISIAAYIFFAFFALMKINYILAALLSIIFSVLAALIMNWLVYRPLRKRKATPVILLIASIMLLLFVSSLMLAVFGSGTKTIPLGSYSKTHYFGFFTITSLQIAVIFSALVLFAMLWAAMKKTMFGKAMRALADNKDAAKIAGINPEKIYTYTFIIASVIGGVSGILIGLEQNLYPRMGVLIIVKGFVSSVIGGLGSVPGSIIGGLFVGLAENLGIWFLPSSYKDVISFAVMLLFLLFRPQGIFGVKTRDDS